MMISAQPPCIVSGDPIGRMGDRVIALEAYQVADGAPCQLAVSSA